MLVALLTIGVCAKGQQNSFTIIQFSDPQLGMFTDNRDFSREIVNFSRAIAVANQLKPALVVVTGDLVNRTGDSAQIAAYKRVAQQLNPVIRLYNVPGNHDVGNEPTAGGIAAYRKGFGADYYQFHYKNLLGIVLNSIYLHSPDAMPGALLAQESWLKQTLAGARRQGYQQIIVFLHQPFFLQEPAEADQYFNIPASVRKKYLAMFKANGIRYVFAGHYHRNALGHDGQVEMVTTGPVGKPLGDTPSGYRVITIRGKQLTHRYYALDSLPPTK